jgi:MFS family permease
VPNDAASTAPQPSGFAALHVRDFSLIAFGSSFILTIAILMQEMALALALYELTGDPLMLGLVGLAEAIPFLVVALFGGALADRWPRKRIALIAIAMILLGSLVLELCMQATDQLSRSTLLWLVFLTLAWLGFARGFLSPALSSLRIELTPKPLYANASAWSTHLWQTGAIVGPVAGAFAYDLIGLRGTLWFVIALVVMSLLCISLVTNTKPQANSRGESVFTSIREGFRFVLQSRLLLYSITLDLVAVLFGGVIAILPAFAKDVLELGPQYVGWLRAAPAIGAVVMLSVLTRYSPTGRLWRNMLFAVFGFGFSTLGFALARDFWLCLAMLFLTGVFDSISVVIRQYLLQVVPPEHLRGRVLSVNSLFVTSSNELGGFVAGSSAKAFGVERSIIAGGILTLLAGTWAYLKGRDLLKLKL